MTRKRKPLPILSERKLFWKAFILNLVSWPFEAWISMLWLGAAHSQDSRVPAFGFWTMFFIGAALGTIIGGSTIALKLLVENINRRLERTL